MNDERTRIGFGSELIAEDTLHALLSDPESPLNDRNSETVKAGKTSLVVRTSIDGIDGPICVAYKRIKRKTLWKRLSSYIESNRAWRNWRIGNWCLEKGISTPLPLAAIVPRRHVADRNSFIVTEWIEDAKDLHSYLQVLEKKSTEERPAQIRKLAFKLGSLLGKMHANGMSHRDLKAGNFLVVEQPKSLQVYLIDLDGAKLHRHLDFERKARNLSRLGLAISQFRFSSASNILRFLKTYLEESEIPFHEWKKWWQSIEKEIVHRTVEKRKKAA